MVLVENNDTVIRTPHCHLSVIEFYGCDDSPHTDIACCAKVEFIRETCANMSGFIERLERKSP